MNIILAINIIGFIISAIGIFLYVRGLMKGELPFRGWRTTVGFFIVVIGTVFVMIANGV